MKTLSPSLYWCLLPRATSVERATTPSSATNFIASALLQFVFKQESLVNTGLIICSQPSAMFTCLRLLAMGHPSELKCRSEHMTPNSTAKLMGLAVETHGNPAQLSVFDSVFDSSTDLYTPGSALPIS